MNDGDAMRLTEPPQMQKEGGPHSKKIAIGESDEANYPRLLVLSQVVPETRYAGSILLYRLLSQQPPDRLLVLGPAPHPESEVLACRYQSFSVSRLERLNRTRFAGLKRSVESLGLRERPPLARIRELVGNFRPQVVVCVMQDSGYVTAAVAYARQERLPLILLVHDFLEDFEQVYDWARNTQRRSMVAMYRAASVRLCISPAMRDFLLECYGVDGSVLYPNRSEHIAARPLEETLQLKNEGRMTIAYAGSLVYGYNEGIASLLPAIESAGHQLRIYSAHRPPWSSSAVEYCGYSPSVEETWVRVQREADAVLLPYSHGRQHERLYRTHFPSKLPEYLALGMPVLVSGPPYATGVAWARQHPGAAMVLDSNSSESAAADLKQLAANADLRRNLAEGAATASALEFDPKGIREEFYDEIRRSIGRNKVP